MPKLTAQDWIEEIDQSLAYRKIFGREEAWRKNELNYYNDPSGHTAIGPNLVFEMGDTILSTAGSLDPEFTATPTHPAGTDRAPLVESLDNQLCKKLGLRKSIARAALNSFLYSRAILKIGYDSEFGWNPKFDIGGASSPLGMSLTQLNPATATRIESKNIEPGMPWVATVPPHDIVVPWGTLDVEDSPWVAHRIIRLNTDIKADMKYKNTSSLTANMSIEDFVYSYASVGVDRKKFRDNYKAATGMERPKAVYNELWEIHDRRDMRVKVVCREHDKFIRDDIDYIALVCGTPFVSGTFVEHARSFWSTPLAYYLGQLQAEQYDISLQAQKQRRINILRFIAAKGFMSPEKLQKLLSGSVGAVEFAEVTDALRDKIIPVPTGNQFDSIVQSNENRLNARATMGMSRNQTGEFDAGTRRTKGEAMLVAQGSRRRESPRVMMVRDLYIDTMRKINQIVFSFWTTPRSIMTDQGWGKFTGGEISGEYLYDLSLTEKRDLSKAERKVEAMMMLGQLMPFLQGQDPKQIFEFLSNAANDPAFEKLLGFTRGGGKGQQPGQPGGSK